MCSAGARHEGGGAPEATCSLLRIVCRTASAVYLRSESGMPGRMPRYFARLVATIGLCDAASQVTTACQAGTGDRMGDVLCPRQRFKVKSAEAPSFDARNRVA